MSNAKLIYDPEHMDEICSKYKQCAEYADQAINNLERLKANFLGNYQGQASEMAEDLYNKIKEHTELLRDCFIQMDSFVTYTKETMIELDNNMASTGKRANRRSGDRGR
ncbi:MAG TPA: WXG100 family type VII secretion target [Acetivibrio sp.]|jgi:uncharacterized protein YukE|nr:hypothetical protein [Clostridium sp.]HPT91751.1 WXG100 family type VII secretion target [Acetivibrio sp.]HQA58465.1 WXG100 family type VII secretion target [Acetivibrio sp.]